MFDLPLNLRKKNKFAATITLMFMLLQLPLGLIGAGSAGAAANPNANAQGQTHARSRNSQQAQGNAYAYGHARREYQAATANKPNQFNKAQASAAYARNHDQKAAAPVVATLAVNTAVAAQDDKISICHASGSDTNPYNMITISKSAAFHAHVNHQDDQDIVPPFTYNGQSVSQNWNAEGQAIYYNNCELPEGQVLGAFFGGRGGGRALSGRQLADTGTNVLGTVFAALALIGLTSGLAVPTLKAQYE